jgi:tetratricopeptide (TPR) repeat protein
MRPLLIAALLAAAFTSCKDKVAADKKDPAAATVIPITPLADSLLFDDAAITKFAAGISDAQRDSGKRVFLQAIDLLKNKKDAAASIPLLMRSLALSPSDKTYYELGNAWLDAGEPKKALTAFEQAEAMEYSPLSYVLFKKACAFSELEDEENSIKFMSHAIENGFVDRDKIFNEPHFANARKSYNFTASYNAAMSGNGDPQTILWEAYSREFKPAVFPLVINEESFKKMGKPAYISYDYEKFVAEMRDYKFSRDVGNEFFYYTKVASGEAYEAFIYGTSDMSYAETVYPLVQYTLVSYSRSGKLIDKLVVAGYKTYDEPFKILMMKENKSFEVKGFKQTYEKDPGEAGYQNNKVVKSELVSTKYYTIDNAGKFKEAKQLAMR